MDEAEEFADMTMYHIPTALARSFKEFCRFHASNKFNVGLEILLNSYKEKESYFYLLDSINELKAEVLELKKNKEELMTKKEEPIVVKTFGREYKR